MIAEIDQMLKANEYQFLKVQPEEAGVYYKYQDGTVQVVLGLLDHDDFVINAAVCTAMKEHIRGLFFLARGNIPGFSEEMPVYQVDILCLAVTKNVEKYRVVCNEIQGIWLLDESRGRLIIYENQPGDFYGLNGKIQNLLDKKSDFNKEKLWINTGIVILNIFIWLIMTFFGDTTDAGYLMRHGAMYPPFVIYSHQWYRLFTCMFIHVGALHLINNMVVLFFTGNRLEKEVGKIKYLLIYLLSGMGGGLLSLYNMVKTGELAVSAGASGAIFGVIGALLWIAIRNRGKVGDLSTKGLAIMIALCLYYGFTSNGVDNWCHMGGLFTGFIVSFFLYQGNWRKD